MAKPREFQDRREAREKVLELTELYHRAGVTPIRVGDATIIQIGANSWLLDDGTIGPAEGHG